MRTTVNLDDDIFTLARSLAQARGVSIGKALSELARRGAVARSPSVSRSGFHTFTVTVPASSFGPEDVAEALDREDKILRSHFLAEGK